MRRLRVLARAENTLKVVGCLLAARLGRVVHQHLGIAQNGRRRCAQFLSHIGNERPLGSLVGPGPVIKLISRGTISLRHRTVQSLSAQAAVGLSKAAIFPSRRAISTGLVS